jgi:hypothetical protein
VLYHLSHASSLTLFYLFLYSCISDLRINITLTLRWAIQPHSLSVFYNNLCNGFNTPYHNFSQILLKNHLVSAGEIFDNGFQNLSVSPWIKICVKPVQWHVTNSQLFERLGVGRGGREITWLQEF